MLAIPGSRRELGLLYRQFLAEVRSCGTSHAESRKTGHDGSERVCLMAANQIVRQGKPPGLRGHQNDSSLRQAYA